MFKRNIIYTAIIVLLLSTWGCDKLIYDDNPTTDNSPTVHISVNLRAVEQGDTRSINFDGNYEDAVHTLAMIIFESGEDKIYSSYFNNNIGSDPTATHAFSVELKAGKKYDFYFVANVPDLPQTIANGDIVNRDQVNSYLTKLNVLHPDLYKGASKMGQGAAFPMARVYMNQNIPSGGTVYQPKPFHPQQYEAESSTVVVNSVGSGDVTSDYVELIRVVAKLEVNIEGTEHIAISKIYYKNAFAQYSLNAQSQPIDENASGKYYEDNVDLNSVEAGKYWMYVPEALMNNATWVEGGTNKPINYFVIEMEDGTKYEVPIITTKDYAFADGYMAYAKEKSYNEKYNIFRNHIYRYTIKNLTKGIEINYEVNPWNKVTKTLYMGYGYNVEIDENGKVTITNTIDDCIPHKVVLKALGNAYFGDDANNKTIEYGYTSKEEITDGADKKGYSENFQLNGISESGPYLEIWYNGTKVKTLSK